LRPYAARLAELIRRFNVEVDRALIRHREQILERQYVQERIARAAMELFASACVLSRWDAELDDDRAEAAVDGVAHTPAELFVRGSFRRARRSLAEMHENDDAVVTAAADWVLRGEKAPVLKIQPPSREPGQTPSSKKR
jgi:acyl-CoA dehydrogenase family protein 9